MKVLRGAVFALMFFLNIALAICLAYLFISRGFDTTGAFSSSELVTIVLAALGVLLTALGIFIAILAIWGYQSLHSIAKETASRVARETADTVASRAASDVLARMGAGTEGDDYGAAAGGNNAR